MSVPASSCPPTQWDNSSSKFSKMSSVSGREGKSHPKHLKILCVVSLIKIMCLLSDMAPNSPELWTSHICILEWMINIPQLQILQVHLGLVKKKSLDPKKMNLWVYHMGWTMWLCIQPCAASSRHYVESNKFSFIPLSTCQFSESPPSFLPLSD